MTQINADFSNLDQHVDARECTSNGGELKVLRSETRYTTESRAVWALRSQVTQHAANMRI